MSNENDGWETIEVSEDKKEVDFEIEEEEEQPVQAQEEVIEKQPEQKVEPEQPKELEGIETKGAEKVRQLIDSVKSVKKRLMSLFNKMKSLNKLK